MRRGKRETREMMSGKKCIGEEKRRIIFGKRCERGRGIREFRDRWINEENRNDTRKR